MNNNPGIIPDYYFFFVYFCLLFAQIFTNITPSTITVDSVNHTYTGTLSSSTYSGYKLAANTNKIVSSGNHTLTGYTGNNITLGITGNTVNVTNSKTSSNRTTELQNFIRTTHSYIKFEGLKTPKENNIISIPTTMGIDGVAKLYCETGRGIITRPTVNLSTLRLPLLSMYYRNPHYSITPSKVVTFYVDYYSNGIFMKRYNKSLDLSGWDIIF